MKEIKCPHCNKVFSVDESEYAELLSQVRTASFNEELNRRMAEMQKSISMQVDLAVAKKEQELTRTYASKEQELNNEISKQSNTISELKAKIMQNNAEKQMAVMEAKQAANEELQKANENLQKAQINMMAIQEKYKNQISQNEEQHKRELEMKDEVIAQYKDFKAKQSTKMIGESLEVYCNNQFDLMVRPYLPTAEFGKDNDIVDGTKGDFVFRDSVDGIESVSIMFEMKNEADETQVKHKNSDFFKKLDSDRTKKNCEYAVLVSLLELDNDLYNNGIYSVPGYEKMYVVRPQQFLTIISLLVQTGRNTVKVKKELVDAKNRDIDVTHFEEKLEAFKGIFGKHVKDAAARYNSALNDIDKAIKQLQDMKEDLRLWVDHLYKAENNFEDITIRKLTYKNPTMRAKLEEAKAQNSTTEIKS